MPCRLLFPRYPKLINIWTNWHPIANKLVPGLPLPSRGSCAELCRVISTCQWSCASFSSPELWCHPSMREIKFCLLCSPTRHVSLLKFPLKRRETKPKIQRTGKKENKRPLCPLLLSEHHFRWCKWHVNAENAYTACKFILMTGSTSGLSQTWPKMFLA